MEKEEILSRAKKEYAKGDERDISITRTATSNAYIAIMSVFIVLLIINLICEIVTGSPFMDHKPFELAFTLGLLGKSATEYFYTKKKSSLTIAILSAIVSMMLSIGIFMGI